MSANTTKTYVISGAASGIGLALVTRLLGSHGNIRIVGIDLTDCPDPRVESVRCDLSDPDAIASLDLPTRIDGLANVAGVPGTAPAELVLAVNTLGARALTARALGSMESGASVVNVSSIAAHRNTLPSNAIDELLAVTDRNGLSGWLTMHRLDGPAAYDTSKRALTDWTVLLSADLLSRGIRVNSVSPGPTETPILSDFEESMGIDAIARSAGAVGRHGTAAESAAAVDFLLSDDASWINGVDIPVEGGLTALRAAAQRPAVVAPDNTSTPVKGALR
ncbi:SDR family oxidoreductase [Gordonia otitidis]|uniref:SDR family oxidoreductase n=1 Tax=Gordonia otitidis TaxID=249058 RepID=UPI001D13E38B|nr:SDR family oxidoreductase [Gordonia otitidis]UEA60943.1 SDR family oxidoreductase [Gordonia otitidis]